MKELICITCPKGCHLKVDEETFAVTGNGCPRGAVYGANELRNPVRVVTSTVIVEGPARRLPVKTDRAIPKGKMFEVMEEIAKISARLIANKSSFKFKTKQIETITQKLEEIIE